MLLTEIIFISFLALGFIFALKLNRPDGTWLVITISLAAAVIGSLFLLLEGCNTLSILTNIWPALVVPTIFLVLAISDDIMTALSQKPSNSLHSESERFNGQKYCEDQTISCTATNHLNDRDRLEWKERINLPNPCQASEAERSKMKREMENYEGSKSFRKMMKKQRRNKG